MAFVLPLSNAMNAYAYGLTLRSAVRARRQRLLRFAIGTSLVPIMWLGFPPARNLAAQLLGDTFSAAEVRENPAFEADPVATPAVHVADNPITHDANLAAGIIVPDTAPQEQLVLYVAAAEGPIVDIEGASAEFPRDTPTTVLAANPPLDNAGMGGGYEHPSGAGGGFGGAGFGSGGFVGGAGAGAGAIGKETSASDSPTSSDVSDERVRVLGRPFTSDAPASSESSATGASSGTSGGSSSGSSTGSGSGSGSGSGASAATPSSTGSTTGSSSGGSSTSAAPGGGASGGTTSETGAAPFSGAAPTSGATGATPAAAATPPAQTPAALAVVAPAAVPEPSELLLMGLGLVVVARRVQLLRRA